MTGWLRTIPEPMVFPIRRARGTVLATLDQSVL